MQHTQVKESRRRCSRRCPGTAQDPDALSSSSDGRRADEVTYGDSLQLTLSQHYR
jgi:hypothetical protein